MIGPLFATLVHPAAEPVAESVAVAVLSALATPEPPPEPPWRERVVSCGCVRREQRRAVGWLGWTVKACDARAAGKSCAAVSGEP